MENGPGPAPAAQGSFFSRHEFFLRRLHSLSGLVPVGAFMCVHLLTNASVLDGFSTFQGNVYRIHSLGRALPTVEWVFIFLPLLFHALFGFVIIRSGESNSGTYQYTSNVRYTLQRVSGMIAFLFIMWHVFHMRGWFHFPAWLAITKSAGGAQFSPYNAASSAALALRGPVVAASYAIGVLACVFHLANGVWTMGITWGVWVTPSAQKRANYVCAFLGLVLAFVGLGGLAAMRNVNVPAAVAAENAQYEARVEAGLMAPDEHKRAGSHVESEEDAKADSEPSPKRSHSSPRDSGEGHADEE